MDVGPATFRETDTVIRFISIFYVSFFIIFLVAVGVEIEVLVNFPTRGWFILCTDPCGLA